MPSYRMLLLILLSVGLGHWIDPDSDASVHPNLRLELARARHGTRASNGR